MNNIPCLAALLSSAVMLLLGACASAGPNDASPEPAGVRTITEADADKPIQVDNGETIHIVLVGNATTGFKWELKDGKDEDSLVSVGDPTYISDPAPSGMVGVGGKQTFVFTAKKPGKGTLQFVYARPFGEHEVGKKAAFKFVVR